MSISNPKLPPRKGFVEVEVNGERVYRAIAPGPAAEAVELQPTAEQILSVLLGEVSE